MDIASQLLRRLIDLGLHHGWAGPAWIAGAVLTLVVAVRRVLPERKPERDAQRLFTSEQRAAMFARAGNRCEHKPMMWFRCRRVPTHGDHIYPHSRGGATMMSNAQALCARCNGVKGARVPSMLYIWRLESRRRKYFPIGEPVRVVHKIGTRV